MAFQPSPGGESDVWVMKIGADRLLKFLTYFGGRGVDSVSTIALQGNSVFLSGDTCSSDLPQAPPRAATCAAAFVTKLAGDGSAVHGTAIVEEMNGRAMAVDAHNRAFVTGNASPSFTPTPDAFLPSRGAGDYAVLVMLAFDEAGPPRVEYATYVGTVGGPVPGHASSRRCRRHLPRAAVHQ